MIRRRNAHDGVSPAVLWWIRDWLTSETVLAMPRASRSLYHDLLLRQALDGSIPSDTRVLASISGESHASFLKLWKHVSAQFRDGDDGRLRNPRMERELDADAEYRARRSAAGKAGNESRWKEHRDEVAHGSDCDPTATGTGLAKRSPSPSSSPSPSTSDASHRPERSDPTGPQAVCAEHWRSEWARTRSGTKCVLKTKDYVAIASMLQVEEPENVRRRMTAILEDSEAFMVKNASITVLWSKWDSFAVVAAKNGKHAPDKAALAREAEEKRVERLWSNLHSKRQTIEAHGRKMDVYALDVPYPGYEAAKRELAEGVA